MSNINVNLNEVFDKIFNDKDRMRSIIDNSMEEELNKQNNSQDFLYSGERTDLLI
ncbi:hypothetical protein TG994_004766 [Salmonella enterica]|nr:hypothetical protein [Salmonella enterica]